jgi:hypothetical protein
MASFDPMAVAIDWLDYYRAASLSIVDLYADGAALECGCNGQKVMFGRNAIMAYWRKRFVEKPVLALEDLHLEGAVVVLSYRVSDDIVRAILEFGPEGKIERSRCGPAAQILPLR